MKFTFNIRSRNLIRVTPENSHPLKNHSVWNIFVSVVETTQKIDKSQTDNLTLTYLIYFHLLILPTPCRVVLILSLRVNMVRGDHSSKSY